MASRSGETRVAYIITEPCIGTKDAACVDVCPVDCIHPRKDEPEFESAEMLFIHPDECIDCGACVPACPVEAIFALDETPEKWKDFISVNAQHLPEVTGAGRFGTMMRRTLRFVLSAVAVVACTLVLRADDQITAGDAELQFQLGNLLSDETRYREALDAFDKAIQTDDRVAAVARARREGEDRAPHRGVRPRPEGSRAAARVGAQRSRRCCRSTPTRSGRPASSTKRTMCIARRSRSTRSRHARGSGSRVPWRPGRSWTRRSPRRSRRWRWRRATARSTPRSGNIYERLNRFDEAANAYNNFINLLPNKDRSDKASWTRSQVKFLKAFEGRLPGRHRSAGPRDVAHDAVQARRRQDRRAGEGERRPAAGLRPRYRVRGDGHLGGHRADAPTSARSRTR